MPTIYLVEKKNVLSVDEAIPKWVQEQLSKVESQARMIYEHILVLMIQVLDVHFSTLDNKEDKPFISSFTYIGDEQKIDTPNDSNDSSPSNSKIVFRIQQFPMTLKDYKMKDNLNFKLFKEDK